MFSRRVHSIFSRRRIHAVFRRIISWWTLSGWIHAIFGRIHSRRILSGRVHTIFSRRRSHIRVPSRRRLHSRRIFSWRIHSIFPRRRSHTRIPARRRLHPRRIISGRIHSIFSGRRSFARVPIRRRRTHPRCGRDKSHFLKHIFRIFGHIHIHLADITIDLLDGFGSVPDGFHIIPCSHIMDFSDDSISLNKLLFSVANSVPGIVKGFFDHFNFFFILGIRHGLLQMPAVFFEFLNGNRDFLFCYPGIRSGPGNLSVNHFYGFIGVVLFYNFGGFFGHMQSRYLGFGYFSRIFGGPGLGDGYIGSFNAPVNRVFICCPFSGIFKTASGDVAGNFSRTGVHLQIAFLVVEAEVPVRTAYPTNGCRCLQKISPFGRTAFKPQFADKSGDPADGFFGFKDPETALFFPFLDQGIGERADLNNGTVIKGHLNLALFGLDAAAFIQKLADPHNRN